MGDGPPNPSGDLERRRGATAIRATIEAAQLMEWRRGRTRHLNRKGEGIHRQWADHLKLSDVLAQHDGGQLAM